MFEKFLSVNSGDFRQRYEGTFGYYTVDGKRKFLCQLDTINIEERAAHFVDRKGQTYHVNADVNLDIGFEFLPPSSAFYNTKSGVFFMERFASRQFKRGVSNSNMKSYIISDKGFIVIPVTFDSLVPVYEEIVSYQEQAELLRTKKNYNIAISPTFVITPTGVFVFKERIGKYDYNNNLVVSKRGALFLTEIKDALRNCGLTEIGVTLDEKT